MFQLCALAAARRIGPVPYPATRTPPLALRAGGASITRGFVLSPLWSSADDDSIGGRASHRATKIFTRRSVRPLVIPSRSTSAGLSRAVVRPGQNATAFAATITAGMVSRTSGTGVMAIVEMPSLLANRDQAQWPAATQRGTPASRASPASFFSSETATTVIYSAMGARVYDRAYFDPDQSPGA